MIVGIAQILIFIFLYPKETPTYLILKNKRNEALLLMNELYYKNEYDLDDSENQLTISQIKVNEEGVTYRNLFTDLRLSKTLKIGCFLSILQQFTGINYIITGSTSAVPNSLIDNKKIETMIIGLVNCLSTILSFFILKKHYKLSLQIGALGMCLSYIVILITLPTGYFFDYVYVISLLIFIVFFECSIGPIMWIYCADVLSEKGIAITTSLNWFAAFIIIVVFFGLGDIIFNNYLNAKFISINILYLLACATVMNIQIFYFAKYKIVERCERMDSFN